MQLHPAGHLHRETSAIALAHLRRSSTARRLGAREPQASARKRERGHRGEPLRGGEEPARPTAVPERYLLFVGKLEPGKAPDRILPILDAARAEIPLLVAGSGSLEADLRARGGNARYLGWVDEERVLALMKHADCLLFPSRWQEPLSRVLFDALALGA